MESRIKRIFLNILLLVSLSALVSSVVVAAEAEESSGSPSDISSSRIFDPQVERREIKRDAIDTEDWELGLHYGLISIEDFGTKEVASFTASYHVTEDFFISLLYGESKAGETSSERLSGIPILDDESNREYKHYILSLGYNVLPGEGFVGRDIAFTSNFYFLTGLGATDFADNVASTVMVGGGYQVLFNDWLAVHFSLKDYFYDTDVLGSSKTANDLEISTGFTLFF